MNKREIKAALEAMMYVWGEPLNVKDAANVLEIDKKYAKELLKELADEYEERQSGLMIRQINGSFQFATRAENAKYIEKLATPVKVKRLSQAALEVLAIIAYRQPVTKSEIDVIRGVRSERVIEGLIAKELVQEEGRKEGIGRPIVYGTTDNFLKQFGFSDISQLPEMYDLESAIRDDKKGEQIILWQ